MREMIEEVLSRLKEAGIEATPGELCHYGAYMSMVLDKLGTPHCGAPQFLAWTLDDSSCFDSLKGWLKRMRDYTIDDALEHLETSRKFHADRFEMTHAAAGRKSYAGPDS